MKHAKLEEYQCCDEHRDDNREDDLHRDVALCARLSDYRLLATKLVASKGNSRLDDTCLADDADETSHGDATNTDRTTYLLEDTLWSAEGVVVDTYASEGVTHGCRVHSVEDWCYEWYEDKPHKGRATRNDKGIFQADDIAKTEHRRRGVKAEGQFSLCSEG